MSSRIWKTTLLAFSISLTFSMALAAHLPYRAKNDEANVVADIHQFMQTGHLHDPTYASGPAYSAWITTVLKISGLEYLDTNWLSPIIGSIGLIIMGLFVLQAIRTTHSVSATGAGTVFATPFLFAFFIGRIRETTHKLLTFTIIFMLLYIIFNFVQSRNEHQFEFVFLPALVTLSALNFFWTAIYGGLLTAALVVAEEYYDHPPRYYLVILATLLSSIMALWSSLVNFRAGNLVRKYIIVFIAATSSSNTPPLSQRASAWPEVAGISLGILLSIGIVIAALLTALAMLHIAFEYLTGKSLQPLAVLAFTIAVLSGVLMVGLLAAGGLPTAKRIIFLPGVLGVIYWVDILTRSQSRVFSLDISGHSNTVLAILLTIILAGSLVGVPRIMLDGKLNPNKFYANDSDLERVEWAGAHAPDCQTHQHIDRTVAAEFGFTVTVDESVTRPVDVVYSGGRGVDNAVTCSG